MSAAVSAGPPLSVDAPRALFDFPASWGDYDVPGNGQRILMLTSPRESSEPAAVAVLNWTEGLRKP